MTTHSFDAELYLWNGDKAAWVFVDLPFEVTDEIEDALIGPRRGFGSVKVSVRVGTTTWSTSIFPSKETYVLPVKKAVREREGLDVGMRARFDVTVVDEPSI